MRYRILWALILVGAAPAASLAMSGRTQRGAGERGVLADRERQVLGLAAHETAFSTVLHGPTANVCQTVRPPEPLATPDPSLDEMQVNSLIVSFIIGTDGHVISALVVDGASPDEDRSTLEAVQLWRYRPALCNGEPIEAEARVSFHLCRAGTGCPSGKVTMENISEFRGGGEFRKPHGRPWRSEVEDSKGERRALFGRLGVKPTSSPVAPAGY